jgi:hypothetical protein
MKRERRFVLLRSREALSWSGLNVANDWKTEPR